LEATLNLVPRSWLSPTESEKRLGRPGLVEAGNIPCDSSDAYSPPYQATLCTPVGFFSFPRSALESKPLDLNEIAQGQTALPNLKIWTPTP